MELFYYFIIIHFIMDIQDFSIMAKVEKKIFINFVIIVIVYPFNNIL